MDKYRIIIWGASIKLDEIISALDFNKCELLGIVDRNPEKQGILWDEKYEIVSPDIFDIKAIDYVLISAQNPGSVISYLQQIDIPREKMMLFWKSDSLIPFLKEVYLLRRENKKLKLRLRNAPYEYGDSVISFIEMGELFRMLREEKKSLSRFGDGEFEIIRGNDRGWFQKKDNNLALRLNEILVEEQDDVIIAIANNFGNLDKYTDDAADGIREYVTPEARKDILRLLSKKRMYGDAYVTRPYLMYKDKTYINTIIDGFRSVWNSRRVIIIENKYSRIGINNDLFDNVVQIRRVICPHKDAFSFYNDIKEAIYKFADKDDLILVSLGQTATILSYDLGINGYQAIDIGQIDTEYEWYLRGANDRIEIPGKSVAELTWWHEPEVTSNRDYNEQVVCSIGDS
ncbi:MAG: DUF1792 domain-containing protein [Lachnospiraceae bacterium]|nr:DUF1792 domain-containing protein [Lachnospiraceae bacterium]